MSCDHLVSPGSVILDGFTEGGDIVLPWDEDDDDEPRRYESVPSFVEDEPILFLPTPKANRAVRD